jgi:chromosome segregation ATPase
LNLSDSHSSEVDLVRAKLREGERRNGLNLEKIEAMAQEMRELQAKFHSERSGLEVSKLEIERARLVYGKEIEDLASQNEEILRRKGEELNQSLLEGQALAKRLRDREQELAAVREESSKNEKQLREAMKRV